ncbi:DUF58 domain-containing protein [Tersicoccus sp. MR15.9]|uniref:DUF58 domain-containing protein n=1 Tax=Tersicoccus mangrovi TaxID=3121635 RepID=UPI002FE5A90A
MTNRTSKRAGTRPHTRTTGAAAEPGRRGIPAAFSRAVPVLGAAARRGAVRITRHPWYGRVQGGARRVGRATGGLTRRYVRPVVGVVGPLGRLVVAAVVVLAVLGLSLGWQEAGVGAIFGTLLLVSAVGFVLGRSAYDVDLDLTRTRVAVGDRAVGAVTVASAASRPLRPASLELPVGAATAAFYLPRLEPGQSYEDLFTIPTSRRTVLTIGPVRSVRADPLHLLRREVTWTEPVELFVHPRTVGLGASTPGFIRDLEGLPTHDLANTDVSFHALRDYQPGDDRRHIHWRSTARTGTLMVRQFEQTRRSHIGIGLSTEASEYDGEADLELAISVATSIGLQAAREQRNLDVITSSGPLRTRTGRTLLDDATRLTGTTGMAAVDLARTTAETLPNASVIFFVVGMHVSAADLRRAAAWVPVGIRTLAVRCGAGRPAARATIGDLVVLTVGSLDELGSVLRRAAS